MDFSRLILAVPPSLCALAALGCGGGGDAPAGDAGTIAPLSDAAPARDGAIVQCQADHQESLEERNDRIINDSNQVEPTGLVLSQQGGFSVCGEFDPAQALREYADVDVYEFTVSGSQPLRLQLTVDDPQGLSVVQMILFGADGPSTIAEARLLGDTAITHRVVPGGTYWVAVLAKTPLEGAAVPYRIQVSSEAILCESSGGAADYLESIDGADNRGNDTLRIDYELSSTFSETPDSDDEPEPTSIELQPGDSVDISGTAANTVALDDYRDRDTYLIHTGTDTQELSLRASWVHTTGVDLDLHLFEAGRPEEDLSFAGAAVVGVSNDELTTIAVFPDRDYWLWLGAYDNVEPQLPQDYTLTLCGHSR